MTVRDQQLLLVSARELSQHLGAADWVIVDCRFNLARPEAGEDAYRKAHIPGAYYAHLDRDLSAPRTPMTGRHPLPEPVTLAALFSVWGITPDTQVVGYDNAGGAIAARLWWLLRWMGHRRSLLLDGGFPAWQAAQLPVETRVPEPQAGAFRGRPGHMPIAELDEIESRLRDPAMLLLDARAEPRYLGREEPIDPVAGHVPGAVCAPFQRHLTATGTFRSPDEIRAQMMPLLGSHRPGDVVSMCGSGVTACHTIFALEYAGFSGARLYPGSWSEWIRSGKRPVERAPPDGSGA